MIQLKISKLLFCISLILILIIIQSVPNAYAKDYTYSEISQILEDNEFFVFNLKFDSLDKKSDLENNEFIFNDKLTVIYLSILEKNPENFFIRPLTINIISPSKKIYNGTFENFGIDYYIVEFPFTLEDDSSITLNETGNWWILIEFNKSDSLMTWFFSDSDSQSFTEASNVKLFYGFSINVMSNSDYQQLKAAKALEESAEASKESINWAIVSTIALSIAAGAAAVSIILNYKQKVRDIKDKCKSRVIECLLDMRFLIEETKNLLDTLKSNNYQYIADLGDLQKYQDIKNRFYELRKSLASDVIYVSTFPEAKKISKKLIEIFIELTIFNKKSLEKLSSPTTKGDVTKARENLKELEKFIIDFLVLIKVKIV